MKTSWLSTPFLAYMAGASLMPAWVDDTVVPKSPTNIVNQKDLHLSENMSLKQKYEIQLENLQNKLNQIEKSADIDGALLEFCLSKELASFAVLADQRSIPPENNFIWKKLNNLFLGSKKFSSVNLDLKNNSLNSNIKSYRFLQHCALGVQKGLEISPPFAPNPLPISIEKQSSPIPKRGEPSLKNLWRQPVDVIPAPLPDEPGYEEPRSTAPRGKTLPDFLYYQGDFA